MQAYIAITSMQAYIAITITINMIATLLNLALFVVLLLASCSEYYDDGVVGVEIVHMVVSCLFANICYVTPTLWRLGEPYGDLSDNVCKTGTELGFIFKMRHS